MPRGHRASTSDAQRFMMWLTRVLDLIRSLSMPAATTELPSRHPFSG